MEKVIQKRATKLVILTTGKFKAFMFKVFTVIATALIMPQVYLSAQKSGTTESKTTLRSFLVKLQTPTGWTIKGIDGADGYICASSDNTSAILILADPDNSLEYYKTMLPYGIDLGQGESIKSRTKLIELSTNRGYSPIDISGVNGIATGTVGLMQKKYGGVIYLITFTQNQSQQFDLKDKMLSMLLSCTELNTAEIAEIKKDDEKAATEVQRIWYTKLKHCRLQKYSSYSSGSGGDGMTSSIYYDLCEGGYYRMYSQFSSTIGSSNEKNDRGTWTLSQDQGSPYLVLRSTTGSVSRYIISSDKDNNIYLNKVKYLIGHSGDVGPRCN
jgi:hypothetical protein